MSSASGSNDVAAAAAAAAAAAEASASERERTARAFVEHVVNGLRDASDVSGIETTQQRIFAQLTRSNATLTTFNGASAAQYAALASDIALATKAMRVVKADLDQIFRRIRVVKQKLAALAPHATHAAQRQIDSAKRKVDDEIEDKEDTNVH